jgi:hypothetical protein
MAEIATPQPASVATVNESELETVIDCVVAPVLHTLGVVAELVSVTEPPWQNVVAPLAVIVGVAVAGFWLIVIEPVLTHTPFVTVTVNVPVVKVATSWVLPNPLLQA